MTAKQLIEAEPSERQLQALADLSPYFDTVDVSGDKIVASNEDKSIRFVYNNRGDLEDVWQQGTEVTRKLAANVAKRAVRDGIVDEHHTDIRLDTYLDLVDYDDDDIRDLVASISGITAVEDDEDDATTSFYTDSIINAIYLKVGREIRKQLNIVGY